MNVCISYPAVLALVEKVSQLYTAPLATWIANNDVVKFCADNVNNKRKPHDQQLDNKSEMLNMYSILSRKSRTPAPLLPHDGKIENVSLLSPTCFLPTLDDVHMVKDSLFTLVSRVITEYVAGLQPFKKSIDKAHQAQICK